MYREEFRKTQYDKQEMKPAELVYFYQSENRYYRRLFAKYMLNKNLRSISRFYEDVLDDLDDWKPEIVGNNGEVTDRGPLSHDDALVMVSG